MATPGNDAERPPVVPCKRRAVCILSGGGFSFEAKRLLSGLETDFSFHFLVTPHGGVPGQDGIPPGNQSAVPAFESVTNRSRLASLNAFVSTLLVSLKLLATNKADVVIAVGCSHAVPMLIAGRLCRRPTCFIESITRVDQLSNTGKIVYRLRLASVFIVQWAHLRMLYPGTRLGTIL